MSSRELTNAIFIELILGAGCKKQIVGDILMLPTVTEEGGMQVDSRILLFLHLPPYRMRAPRPQSGDLKDLDVPHLLHRISGSKIP